MKKIISIILLIIGFFAQAQFTPGQLKELTQKQATALSNEIANNSKSPLVFVEAKENTKGDYYVMNFGTGENMLKVVFNVFYKGENKALEIKGEKIYRFYQAFGTYLDLFPTWKKIFKPEAELEKTVDDFNSQELIDKSDKVNFKFKGEGKQWSITNWS
ncbi:hypothetical protein MW871_14970 [Flavobacterium sp. I-SCBP12n]|uniref:Uncharacterized protein n=1 Tax=Flavobacterium pygoscelis TaxID=2893176 RepID=A0A9X1XSU7_9FLAO|nr:hypothetical protein [Flavobacterium pygoscelis]MCK8143190.1 hypothetical protein [Flavobacterium pygoscelis]